jgi:proteic killer suppression protein
VKRLRGAGGSETALVLSDMALSGLRLHPLRGDRAGQWSVSISGNWRVIFESRVSTSPMSIWSIYH